MNWKTGIVFLSIQAAGVWCIYSSTRDANTLGWWLFLLPGTLALPFVSFAWSLHAGIILTISINATIWYAINRAAKLFTATMISKQPTT